MHLLCQKQLFGEHSDSTMAGVLTAMETHDAVNILGEMSEKAAAATLLQLDDEVMKALVETMAPTQAAVRSMSQAMSSGLVAADLVGRQLISRGILDSSSNMGCVCQGQ